MEFIRPSIRVVSAEIQRDQRYLIVQRSPKAVLPLLWEFPGGRARENENDHDALRRAVHERIGVELKIGDKLLEVTHDYDAWAVTLAVYRCTIEQEPWAQNVAAIAWVAAEDFADYPFPGADQRTVEVLVKEA